MKFDIKEITINEEKFPCLCDINAIETIQNRWGLSTLRQGITKHGEYNLTELADLVSVLTTEACEVNEVEPIELDEIKYNILGSANWADIFEQVVDVINTSMQSAKNAKTAQAKNQTRK